MQVCFIGHRNIEKTEELISSLKETVVTLINKGATTFLFGSKSDFDDLSWDVVTELKKKYPFIKRVYVRSSYQYIDKLYEEYLLESFEETYFPQKIENAGKFSYVERNYEMIDNSTYCVFYYNENYIPSLKYPPKRNTLFTTRRNSGTKIAYEYAVRKKKEIINLYNSNSLMRK
ncbi:MAG: DUF1273 family protein [Clostridia bacterium]|nr:DUF1273 family protein [Clostridia bacterium]